MQANRRGLLKRKQQEKTRNKLRRKLSSALLVADRNRVSGSGQRLRLSMKGSPRRRDLSCWLGVFIVKVVPTADGNNVARSSEANFRNVKVVRDPPKLQANWKNGSSVGLEPTTASARLWNF